MRGGSVFSERRDRFGKINSKNLVSITKVIEGLHEGVHTEPWASIVSAIAISRRSALPFIIRPYQKR